MKVELDIEGIEFKKLLQRNAVCAEGKKWCEGKSLQEYWQSCQRGDWMLFFARKMRFDKGWGDIKQLTLAKTHCAELVKHLVKDEWLLKSFEYGYEYSEGKFPPGSEAHEWLDSYQERLRSKRDTIEKFRSSSYQAVSSILLLGIDPYYTVRWVVESLANNQEEEIKLLKQCANIARQVITISF